MGSIQNKLYFESHPIQAVSKGPISIFQAVVPQLR